jgi:hypothetical protein
VTREIDVEEVLRHYMVAALWTSTDDNDCCLDARFGTEDIHPDSVRAMGEDVQQFVLHYAPLLTQSGLDDAQIGYDLWLTRNGHGAGFWDRGIEPPELGERLSDGCRDLGERYLYVGDDGRVHVQ